MKSLIGKVRVYTKPECTIDDTVGFMLPNNLDMDEKRVYDMIAHYIHNNYGDIEIEHIVLMEYKLVYHEDNNPEYEMF